MYSRESGYAICALVRLAKLASCSGKYLHLTEIVDGENRPTQYLAKILQRLSREGILQSRRGPIGGFAFRLPPDKVDLLKIIRAIDGGIPCFERGALEHTQPAQASTHARCTRVGKARANAFGDMSNRP